MLDDINPSQVPTINLSQTQTAETPPTCGICNTPMVPNPPLGWVCPKCTRR
ncbi:MAG TPA: hypothetical protein VIL71_15310 [Spirillospora sp.]